MKPFSVVLLLSLCVALSISQDAFHYGWRRSGTNLQLGTLGSESSMSDFTAHGMTVTIGSEFSMSGLSAFDVELKRYYTILGIGSSDYMTVIDMSAATLPTGVVSPQVSTVLPTEWELYTLDADPASNYLYGVGHHTDAALKLIRIPRDASGVPNFASLETFAIPVTFTQAMYGVSAMDYDNRFLYVVLGDNANAFSLAKINLATNEVTSMTIPDTHYDIVSMHFDIDELTPVLIATVNVGGNYGMYKLTTDVSPVTVALAGTEYAQPAAVMFANGINVDDGVHYTITSDAAETVFTLVSKKVADGASVASVALSTVDGLMESVFTLYTAGITCDNIPNKKTCANGVTCPWLAGYCNSGFCIDTYCCDNACAEEGFDCNVLGSEGTCKDTYVPVPTLTRTSTAVTSGTHTFSLSVENGPVLFNVSTMVRADEAGVTFANQSPASTTEAASVFTFTASRESSGTITLHIDTGVLVRLLNGKTGNANDATATATGTVDADNAVADIATTATIFKAAPMQFTLTFGEPMDATDFEPSDLLLRKCDDVAMTSCVKEPLPVETVWVSATSTVFVVDVLEPCSRNCQKYLELSCPAGALHDSVGNPNGLSVGDIIIWDTVLPTVTTADVADNYVNVAINTVTVEFAEKMKAIGSSSVKCKQCSLPAQGGTCEPCTAAWLSGADLSKIYSFSMTASCGVEPTCDKYLTFTVLAGALDEVGNAMADNAVFVDLLRYDTTVPTVSITANGAAEVFQNNLEGVRISLSKPLVDLVYTDFTVSNALFKIESITADGPLAFNAVLSTTAAARTTFTISLAAGKRSDGAGNANAESSVLTFTYDTVAPFVTEITHTTLDYQPYYAYSLKETFAFTINMSEPCPTVSSTIITCTNCKNVLDLVANGDNTLFTVITVADCADGVGTDCDALPVSIHVASGAFTDDAGNTNLLTKDSPIVYYDSRKPTMFSNNLEASGKTKDDPFVATFTFSEDVIFTSTSYTVANSEAVDVKGDITMTRPTPADVALTYDYPVDTETTLTYTISGLSDLAGNEFVSQQYTMYIDNKKPQGVFDAFDANVNTATYDVYLRFHEDVYEFSEAAVECTGCTVAVVAVDAKNYKLTLSAMPDEGTVTVSIKPDLFRDDVGNLNLATSAQSFYHDVISPSIVSVGKISADPTGTSPVVFAVSFRENVTNVEGCKDTGCMTVATVPVSTVTISNIVYVEASDHYLVSVTMEAHTHVALTLTVGRTNPADNEIVDVAGNKLSNTMTQTISYDDVGPHPIINYAGRNPTNEDIVLTVTFEEGLSCSGMLETGVNVTNGDIISFGESADSKTYDITVRPVADGNVIVSVLATQCVDTLDNPNHATAAPRTVLYDKTFNKPTIAYVVTDDDGIEDRTNKPSITVRVTFDEKVLAGTFTADDITISPSNVLELIKGTTLTTSDDMIFDLLLTIDPTAVVIPVITAQVAADVCQDEAHNLNVASDIITIRYDGVGPVPTLSCDYSQTVPANKPFDVTVSFDEPVLGFNKDVLTVTNGETVGFAPVDSTHYTVSVVSSVASGSKETMVISFVSNAVTDDTLNLNTEIDTINVVYDLVAPTVQLTYPDFVGLPEDLEYSVTVRFSKPVDGFDHMPASGDITVTNGDVTAFVETEARLEYSVTVVPHACTVVTGCDVLFVVNANAATDDAKNGNTQASCTTVYDTIVPELLEVTYSADVYDETKITPLEFNLTFSEPVLLNASRIFLENAEIVDVIDTYADMITLYLVPVSPAGPKKIHSVVIYIDNFVASDRTGHESVGNFTHEFNFDFCDVGKKYDCAGVCGGSAKMDPDCGRCSGGTTKYTLGDCVEDEDENFLSTPMGYAALGGAGVLVVAAVVGGVCLMASPAAAAGGKGKNKKKKRAEPKELDLIATSTIEFDDGEGSTVTETLESGEMGLTSQGSTLDTLAVNSLEIDIESGVVGGLGEGISVAPLPPPSLGGDIVFDGGYSTPTPLDDVESIDVDMN